MGVGTAAITMTPEAKIKLQIRKILNSYGSQLAYYMAVPTGFGRAGIEDITVCAWGRFLAIEAKKDFKTKPTELQLARKGEVMLAGGIYVVIYAENIHRLPMLLEAFRNASKK